jgi:hypothetical protein
MMDFITVTRINMMLLLYVIMDQLKKNQKDSKHTTEKQDVE